MMKNNVTTDLSSDTDSNDQKIKITNSESSSNCELSTDEIVFEGSKTDKDYYAISWNNIFYEIDEDKTNFISNLFKRNKFKDEDNFMKNDQFSSYQNQFNNHSNSHHFNQFPANFHIPNVHIIERHKQQIEIINNQRTIQINQKIENETIKQINQRQCKKVILNNVSGALLSGQLLGLIGPSGVGKSTLLQILSGRRTHNVKGNVYLHSSKENNLKNCKSNKLSFIPQNDTHIENLTVKETLIYASKLKNSERAKDLIKQNHNFNQDNSSNTTISLPNTSPTNLTNSSTDTIYSGSNSSSISSSLNVSNHLDNSSVNHLNSVNHLGSNLDNNLDHNLESNNSIGNSETLEVNTINEKQTSILLNFTHTDQYHDYLVNEIISELMLDNCADTFVNKCSGGQTKRLSIALELLSQPKVIIMDEPTTGQDFSSALNCIQILKNLTNNFDPPAIIVSIHQPSSSIVKLFDKLYVLAKGGNCIYNGNTTNLVNYLNKFNFNCPIYFNPTDLMIQISSLEYGEKRFKEMVNYQSLITKQELIKDTYCLKYKYDLSKLIDDIVNEKKPNVINQIRLLIERDILNSSRRPLLNILRFCYFSFFALFIYFTYNYDIGQFNGCYSELVNTSNNLNQLNYAQKLAKLSDNSSILFFITMFLVISSIMPAALTFPNEISIFIKERSNCWYSAFTYYIAKFIADLPSYVAFPVLFACLFYPLTQQLTNQFESFVRFWWFNIIVLLNSLITRSIGMTIGSLFLKDTLSAVFVSTCAIFPFMLSAGFLIRQSVSTWILKPFWYLGFIRYTFGCLLIIVYGWGRCTTPILTNQQRTSETQLFDNLAINGLKSLMSNYLKPNEMKCLMQDNENSNFSLFSDIMNECDINMNQIKGSMINNLTLTNLEKYDNSFILNYFELTNDDFPAYVLNLVLIFAALTVINYWILLYKIKKCSQF